MRISSVAIVFLAGLAPAMGFRSHLYRGGSPKTSSLNNFAPGGGKPYAPTSGSGMGNYLENVGPAPDIQPSPPDIPPPPPSPPAAAAAPVKKASYAPGGGKPYAVTGGTGMGNYLENVAAPAAATPPPPPPVPPPPAPPAAVAAPVKPASYAPGGGKPYAATGGTGMGNYLENVAAPAAATPPPPPPVPPPSAPPAAVAAPVKPASYAPGGGKPYAATGGTGMGNYLDNVAAPAADATPPPPAAPAAEAAPTSASYLNQMGGGSSAPVKPASYAPGGGKPYAATGGTGMGNYLENVAAPAAEATPPPAAPAEAAPAPAAEAAMEIFGSYLDGAGSAPVKPASYAPGGGKPYAPTGGSGMGNYLDNVGQAAEVSATPQPDGFGDKPAFVPAPAAEAAPIELGSGETMIAQEPVLTAINELNANMVANQEATIAVLHDINDSVKALSDKAI